VRCGHNCRVTVTAPQPANLLDLLRRRTSAWRWLAVVVALAFALLVSTAATHHHPAGQDRDCAICAAVVHAVSDTVLPVAVPVACYVLLYALERTPTASLRHAVQVPFPCICGPPSRTL
jgi:hypothetical protein